MELDELREKWVEHDRKLDECLRLTRQLLTAGRMNKARWALRRLAIASGLEAVLGLAVVFVLGSFIGDHYREARFVAPAIVLDLFAIATLILLVQQIRLALDIDYGQPVAVIQKRLELLRMLGIRSLQWTLLLSPALWAPLLVVGFKGVLGVDAYQAFGVPYLLANLAVGLAVIPLGLWVVKKLGGRIGASPVMRRVMGDLAGYNLKAAMEFVGSVEEFERDRA